LYLASFAILFSLNLIAGVRRLSPLRDSIESKVALVLTRPLAQHRRFDELALFIADWSLAIRLI
jgi:hypothetical protein